MARQLKARGRDVRLLVAFDMAPWNSGAVTTPRHLPYLGALLRNALPWAVHHRLFRQPSLGSIRDMIAQKAAVTAATIAAPRTAKMNITWRRTSSTPANIRRRMSR